MTGIGRPFEGEELHFIHKRFEGTAVFRDGKFHGKLIGIDDLVTFVGDDWDRAADAFVGAVTDYIKTRETVARNNPVASLVLAVAAVFAGYGKIIF